MHWSLILRVALKNVWRTLTRMPTTSKKNAELSAIRFWVLLCLYLGLINSVCRTITLSAFEGRLTFKNYQKKIVRKFSFIFILAFIVTWRFYRSYSYFLFSRTFVCFGYRVSYVTPIIIIPCICESISFLSSSSFAADCNCNSNSFLLYSSSSCNSWHFFYLHLWSCHIGLTQLQHSH